MSWRSAAVDGVGLAYLGEDRAVPHLDSGALVRVLEPWCQPFPGFFLYCPQSTTAAGGACQ
jgi:DNA-binding transcriptional LysR family regulator